MTTPKILNAGQEAAAEGFFKFLMSKDNQLIISGPGGVGKTYLMSYLIDTVLPEYHKMCELLNLPMVYDEVVMTATTNTAADILGVATKRPTQTIHSFLNLKVTEDYLTGEQNLMRTKSWKVHTGKIIFIDESSMINRELFKFIQEGTMNCKIVYVGDHCQLAPVFETISPVYTKNFPFFELTEPMRNAGNPALMAVCQQLRETVETGIFKPIRIVPGSIDLLGDDDLQEKLVEEYSIDQPMDQRILAYSNKRVMVYNDHIRELRGQNYIFLEGETLVNNSAVTLPGCSTLVSAETACTITKNYGEQLYHVAGVEMHVQRVDLKTPFGEYTNVLVPSDRIHFMNLLKYFAKQKNWYEYYNLKNNFPDLRPFDSATVYKAQGSTYKSVLLDLTNISTCNIANQAARMLYVGFTRAQERVYLYGNLKPEYGGLIV